MMKAMKFSQGTGRTQVQLSIQQLGSDFIVCLFNARGHIGAVAVADYDSKENRASTSVITRLGHKDDQVACNAAYKLCRLLQKPVCAIAGIHLDNITKEEIVQITRNCDALVEKCIESISY
jgi:gallate decarboxylase subunit D